MVMAAARTAPRSRTTAYSGLVTGAFDASAVPTQPLSEWGGHADQPRIRLVVVNDFPMSPPRKLKADPEDTLRASRRGPAILAGEFWLGICAGCMCSVAALAYSALMI